MPRGQHGTVGHGLYRLVAPAMGRHFIRSAAALYGLMLVFGVAGTLLGRVAPAAPGQPAAASILEPLVQFAYWFRDGWQVKFPAFVGLNLALITGFGLLTAYWRPVSWLAFGIFGFNLTATCLTLGYMGLFVLFLGTLLPEIFAFLLGINAGLNLNERRASGVKPWLRAEDVWLLLGVLVFLIPAGVYEAFFIANVLSH